MRRACLLFTLQMTGRTLKMRYPYPNTTNGWVVIQVVSRARTSERIYPIRLYSSASLSDHLAVIIVGVGMMTS